MKIFQRLTARLSVSQGSAGNENRKFSRPWKNPRENFQALENRKE
jgi:hypothetical protein